MILIYLLQSINLVFSLSLLSSRILVAVLALYPYSRLLKLVFILLLLANGILVAV